MLCRCEANEGLTAAQRRGDPCDRSGCI